MDFDANKLFTIGLIVVIVLVIAVVCFELYDWLVGPSAPSDEGPPAGVYMPAGTLIQDDEGSTGEIPFGEGQPYVKDGKEVPYTYTVRGRQGLWYEKWFDVNAKKPWARGKDGRIESPYLKSE